MTTTARATAAAGGAGRVAPPGKDAPAPPAAAGGGLTLVLSGGCFWGLEYALTNIEGITTVPGYAGGHRKGTNSDSSPRHVKPTYYNLVDSGDAEAVRVVVTKKEQLRAVLRAFAAHSAADPAPSDKPRYARRIACHDKDKVPHVTQALAELGIRMRVAVDDAFVEAEKIHHRKYLKLYGRPD